MENILLISSVILAVLSQTVAIDIGEDRLTEHALTPVEYKITMGEGYVFFEILEPEELSYTYKLMPADFSADWNTTYPSIGLVPSDPQCGCGAFTNAEDVEGKIALVERGECSFLSKAIRAQEAGALAVIIVDNEVENDDYYITMTDDTTDRKVDIPAGFLLGKNGFVIRRTLDRLHRDEALIHIPINITNMAIHKLNQPPWLVW